MKKASDEINLWIFDNFATSEECQELLDLANKKGYQASEVQSLDDTTVEPSSGGIGSKKVIARNSSTSFVGNIENENKDILNTFTRNAKNALKSLGKNGPGDQVDNVEIEGLQVQRYLPGQKYNPHYDTFEDKESTQQRWWTVMIYLGPDDGLEGGSTYFPKIEKHVNPKQGRAVIWNNLDSYFCRDVKTLHMGSEVKKGTKYVVTIWFRKPPGKKYMCRNRESFINPDFYQSKDPDNFNWWVFAFGTLFIILIYYLLFS